MNHVSEDVKQRPMVSRRTNPDEGFTLVEVIIAISLLGLVIAFMAGDLVTSAWGTQQSQARLVAQEIASRTLQQVESLGYEAAAEGVECNSDASPCTVLQQPLNQVQASGGCFYFVPSGSSLNTNADPIVPTQYNPPTSAADAPLNPNLTASATSYAPPIVNGVTYTVVTIPMFNSTAYPNASPAVNCTNVSNGTAADVPVNVVVEVSWGATRSQHVSMQTQLFADPVTSLSAGNCPTPAAEQGAHDEELMANAGIVTANFGGTQPPTVQVGNMTDSMSGDLGISVMFLDEKPTPNSAIVCMTDTSGGAPVEEPISNMPGYRELSYGATSEPGYYGPYAAGTIAPNGSTPAITPITPVHPTKVGGVSTGWQVGSSPNAGAPPTAGTTCSGTTCSLEVQYVFQVPSSDGSGTVTGVTVAELDHEGDLDYATWTVTT